MDKQFLYYSDGQSVEVPKKVFDVLVESDNKIRYFEHDLKVELTVRRKGQRITLPSREDSLDRLLGWSDVTGIPRMTICNRKYKILAKIKKLMGF